MIITLSPAKSLDFSSQPFYNEHSVPQFLDHSKELIKILRKKSPEEISNLMDISNSLGKLNYDRYQAWTTPRKDNAKQAIFAFNGAVYRGFDFKAYSKQQFIDLQKKVRILSGLYGMLKPFDLIMPYRLEMGTKLKNKQGKDLYDFWKETVTNQIDGQCKDALINLASREYADVIDYSKLKCKIITPIFKDFKNGKYKVIGLYAKKARGMFADFVVKNDVPVNGLKMFSEAGYKFDEKSSSNSELVFLRKK